MLLKLHINCGPNVARRFKINLYFAVYDTCCYKLLELYCLNLTSCSKSDL